MKIKRSQIWQMILLILILLGAFFLRFHDIENIPSGIYPDEAVNGIDAQTANATGNYRLLYPDNNGREGLFINLQALSIKFFGNSVFALKFCSIIIGTLTVLGVFLLSKEIFQSFRAGLISAYLSAFSYWMINFSRIGFRAIMVPLLLTFSFYFLLLGFRTKKITPFIFSGLIFGLGFHTYIAFRIAPAIIIALLFFMLITQQQFLKNYWKNFLVFVLAIFISLSPMLYEFHLHPEYLESRSASISIFSSEMNQGKLIPTALRSFGLSLVKYNFWGDQNWRHNYPPYPILDPILGASFLTGLIYLVFKALQLLWLRFRHDVHNEKLYLYFFLLAWFFLMLAPEFLTAEGLPHALRSIGTQPVVMIIATFPFLWILGKIPTYSYSAMKIFSISLLTSAFLFIGVFNTVKYFVFFKENPKQHSSFNTNLKNIAYYIRTIEPQTAKFFVSPNMERIPLKYLNPDLQNITYLNKEDFVKLNLKNKKIAVFMPERYDEVIGKIQSVYPQMILIEHGKLSADKFWEIKN